MCSLCFLCSSRFQNKIRFSKTVNKLLGVFSENYYYFMNLVFFCIYVFLKQKIGNQKYSIYFSCFISKHKTIFKISKQIGPKTK